MIFGEKKKKEAIDAFSGYLDKKVLGDMLDGKFKDEEANIGEINYLIVQVKDKNLRDFESDLQKVVSVVLNYGGIINGVFSSFIFVYFDKNVHDSNIKLMANKIMEDLKANVRLVYGKGSGVIKNVGMKEWLSYGPLIIGLSDIFNCFCKLNFGESKEIDNMN
jgi:hypothetical protein